MSAIQKGVFGKKWEQQLERKRELRESIPKQDIGTAWAYIDLAVNTYRSRANLVRVVAYKNGFYFLVSHGAFYDTGLPEFYLLHDSEFFVRWVGSGPNAYGAILDYDELEDFWAIHEAAEMWQNWKVRALSLVKSCNAGSAELQKYLKAQLRDHSKCHNYSHLWCRIEFPVADNVWETDVVVLVAFSHRHYAFVSQQADYFRREPTFYLFGEEEFHLLWIEHGRGPTGEILFGASLLQSWCAKNAPEVNDSSEDVSEMDE